MENGLQAKSYYFTSLFRIQNGFVILSRLRSKYNMIINNKMQNAYSKYTLQITTLMSTSDPREAYLGT